MEDETLAVEPVNLRHEFKCDNDEVLSARLLISAVADPAPALESAYDSPGGMDDRPRTDRRMSRGGLGAPG